MQQSLGLPQPGSARFQRAQSTGDGHPIRMGSNYRESKHARCVRSQAGEAPGQAVSFTWATSPTSRRTPNIGMGFHLQRLNSELHFSFSTPIAFTQYGSGRKKPMHHKHQRIKILWRDDPVARLTSRYLGVTFSLVFCSLSWPSNSKGDAGEPESSELNEDGAHGSG